MARTPPNKTTLTRLTSETAASLKQSLAAGHPVSTKLIVKGMAEMLRDEELVTDLVQRSATGENAFGALLRQVIREEAEQMAQAALAAPMLEAA